MAPVTSLPPRTARSLMRTSTPSLPRESKRSAYVFVFNAAGMSGHFIKDCADLSDCWKICLYRTVIRTGEESGHSHIVEMCTCVLAFFFFWASPWTQSYSCFSWELKMSQVLFFFKAWRWLEYSVACFTDWWNICLPCSFSFILSQPTSSKEATCYEQSIRLLYVEKSSVSSSFFYLTFVACWC